MNTHPYPIKVTLAFGTRPEAIKMLPLYLAMKRDPRFAPTICLSGQHKEMVSSVLDTFGVSVDGDLDVMQPGQPLSMLTGKLVERYSDYFASLPEKPDYTLVHGDTTTAFSAALSSFYQQIPVGHVEAGLRTKDLDNPFPEEANRRLIKVLSALHFTPTLTTLENLKREGVGEHDIFLTGNTVIDALLWMRDRLTENPALAGEMQEMVDSAAKKDGYILVTCHRRESHGEAIQGICLAIAMLAELRPDLNFIFPVHPHPNVKSVTSAILSNIPNVHLIPPQGYAQFIYLMMHAKLILTDSGGVQEEAPSLGCPVLVMRDVTERQEAVDAGTVRLIGTSTFAVINHVTELLDNPDAYSAMTQSLNPYGDGTSCAQIMEHIATHFATSKIQLAKTGS